MSQPYQVPGMDEASSQRVIDLLQNRLTALIDMELTLKHIHWNVVGPSFIGVHQMLDPQVDSVRLMVDAIAERIATLGGEPTGTPGFVSKNRTWDDYDIGRATTQAHLGALDVVYQGLIRDHRKAMEELGELDLVSQDMLVGQTNDLEQYHWFVRAHLEDSSGHLSTEGATSLQQAASQADPSS